MEDGERARDGPTERTHRQDITIDIVVVYIRYCHSIIQTY
jgi:hypothetical protein